MYDKNYYNHLLEIQLILRQCEKKHVSTTIKKLNSYVFNNCYNDKSLTTQEYTTLSSYVTGIVEGIQIMLTIDLRKDLN